MKPGRQFEMAVHEFVSKLCSDSRVFFDHKVRDSDTRTLYSRLGVQISWRCDFGDTIVVPEIMFGWEHEFLDDDETVNATFVGGGGAFGVNTSNPQNDSVYFGAGVTARLSDRTSLFARYEGTANGEGEVHGITGGVRINF